MTRVRCPGSIGLVDSGSPARSHPSVSRHAATGQANVFMGTSLAYEGASADLSEMHAHRGPGHEANG